MASARDIRSAVRSELNKQVKIREDAALRVHAASMRVADARARLAAAEQDAGQAVAEAAGHFDLQTLSDLTGVPVPELRRLVRTTRDAAGSEPAEPGPATTS